MSVAPRTALRRTDTEAGQVMVLLAIVLIVLLGAAALVVDLGYAYYTQRSLQASADAAALAGASGLPDASAATTRAVEYAASGGKNSRDNLPPVTTHVTTRCAAVAPCNPVNAIVVEERSRVPTRFAKLLGFPYLDVKARATACSPCGARPLDIVLVLDRTGSMCATSSGASDPSCTDLVNARQGILDFLSFMDPEIDKIGLAVFPPKAPSASVCATPASSSYDNASSPYVLVPLSGDYKLENGDLNPASSLVSTIQCLRAAGSTAYATAVERAQAELAANGRPGVQKVIVLLSDGAANYGPSYYSNTSDYRRRPCRQGVTSAAAAKAAGTIIYTIGYDLTAEGGGANICQSYTGATESPAITATTALRSMATAPDHFYNKPGPGELNSIYTAIASEIGGARLIDESH